MWGGKDYPDRAPGGEAHADLMRRAAAGEHLAFDVIYQENRRSLLGFIHLHYPTLRFNTTQDVLSEVFSRLWQHRDRLLTIGNIRSYLCVTARNVISDGYRQRAGIDIGLPGDPPSPALPVVDLIEHKAIAAETAGALGKLSGSHRLVLELRQQGLSAKEIGARIGCTEKAVERRLEKAKAAFRIALSLCGRACAWDRGRPEECPAEKNNLHCPRWLSRQGLRP
jgi:RNA polymerase sigma-70 factor (ECF subfamily)